MAAGRSVEAVLTITEAVERFRDSVSLDDRTLIEDTKMKDVMDALISIQQELQQRRENRNLRKLYPFLLGLERYSGAIDTLSNGLSPYLPWIWAPVKLMLKITSDYLGAFDKLIDAYGRIAETMPRLKNLGDAFKNSPALLTKLALYYADILEFHRRAYKFIRRKSWKFFFATTWANFDFRFNSILASMAKISEAIDREAVTLDIIESRQWREKLASQVATREKDRLARQRQSVIAWLALDHLPQDDNREKLLRDCLEGSCAWVLKQEKVASWMKTDSKQAAVWLHGKPGAGKSVICTSLIDSLEQDGITTLSYFCKYHQNDTLSTILKTLVLKIIENDPDLATIAFTEFVEKYREPSLKILRIMLIGSGGKQGLLNGIPICRIVIDGLDECNPKEQKYIVEDLLQFVSVRSGDRNCKLLISSRDVPEISRAVRKKQKAVGLVSLSNEHDSVNHAIQVFVGSRLRELAEEKESLQIGDKVVEEIVRIMIDKADGMFLWARLVLDSLSDVDSVKELHEAITSMPGELPQLYTRILGILCPIAGDGRTDKVMRILAWLVFAKRPLKRHELLHGVSITPNTPALDEWNLLDASAIDKCKPLVEELPDGSVALIHFTVEDTNCSTRRLNSEVWERSIAFACVTVLEDGLRLLDPEISQIDQLLVILSGSHALLLYAIDFWLEHVLACAGTGHLPQESSLGQALSSLNLLHDRLLSILKPSASSASSDAIPSTQTSSDSRLEAMSHLSIYSLCASILTFRADSKDKSASNGQEFEELALTQDSTLFTTLSVRFIRILSQLLSESFNSPEIPENQLDRFRRQYLQFSFRCRFAPCTGASLGFASETLRASHERLHVKRLFCDKPNCSRGRIGFRHQNDLDAHKRAYHEEGGILVPPRVRKRFNASISYNNEAFSNVNNHPALPARTQQHVTKHQTLIPFEVDEIKQALTTWRQSRPQEDGFAVLLNEKFKSSLDVSLICTLQHTGDVSCVDLSPDERLVATGGDNFARVFDIRSGSENFCFYINSNDDLGNCSVRGIRFSSDGHYLVTAATDGLVRIWQLGGCSVEPKVFQASEEGIYSVDVAPDGHTFVIGSWEGLLQLWDIREDAGSVSSISMGDANSGGVWDLAISPDSQMVAAAYEDKSLKLWGIGTGLLLQKFSAHQDYAISVAFSPDSRTLVSGCFDNSIMTWEIDLTRFQVSTQPIKHMKLHRVRFKLTC
ncbi:hypothetical protein CHU98_g7433 [Xylaria longipes]|nr:hypothetical protein CHU98_g7433 [Xylaria longipes]